MIITIKLQSAFGSFDEELGQWYRLIEIDSGSNLQELHYAIQSAIGFDDDHLYEFFISSSPYSQQKIRFDDENEGLWQYIIEDLFPLPPNKKFYYLFDYGDSWYFRITKPRKKLKSAEANAQYPRVVEKVGKDLEQYPEYDEE